MRKEAPVRLNSDVLALATARAESQSLTLTAYVERLIRSDLKMPPGHDVEVIAPSDIRDYKPTPIEGESTADFAFREQLMAGLLKQSGH